MCTEYTDPFGRIFSYDQMTEEIIKVPHAWIRAQSTLPVQYGTSAHTHRVLMNSTCISAAVTEYESVCILDVDAEDSECASKILDLLAGAPEYVPECSIFLLFSRAAIRRTKDMYKHRREAKRRKCNDGEKEEIEPNYFKDINISQMVQKIVQAHFLSGRETYASEAINSLQIIPGYTPKVTLQIDKALKNMGYILKKKYLVEVSKAEKVKEGKEEEEERSSSLEEGEIR